MHTKAKTNTEPLQTMGGTVKTLYNITRYNRMFNIRHKYAGNGSVSIKIPCLKQNIHLTTSTVTSRNRYTFSIENEFIITEFLPCVRQFCGQVKVFCMNRYLSFLIRGNLCNLMQCEAELMYTFGTMAFLFICMIFSATKCLWCWNVVLVRISL